MEKYKKIQSKNENISYENISIIFLSFLAPIESIFLLILAFQIVDFELRYMFVSANWHECAVFQSAGVWAVDWK